MSEAPVRLCCGMRHTGIVCPDDLVMCELCFQRVPIDRLWVDGDGVRWDVCSDCRRTEESDE